MIDTESATLHMVQLCLDPRRLAQLGKMLRLPLARTRTPYLVHCALGELFQDQAPKPFSVEAGPKRMPDDEKRCTDAQAVRVLGYAAIDDAALHELARGFASPAVYNICEWDALASKPMPEVFPEGLRFRFEVRVCPVVRKASAGKTSTGKTWKKGDELDAFLSKVWEIDDPDVKVDREAVYRDWLRRQLALRGGAEADTVGMKRFSIERMTRRTHGPDRTVRTIQRPDVTLAGMLTVTDGLAFAKLLQTGIGRHTSFGFGMLKLRRA